MTKDQTVPDWWTRVIERSERAEQSLNAGHDCDCGEHREGYLCPQCREALEARYKKRATHNSLEDNPMIVTNSCGDKILTNAWDYAIDFSGGRPRLNMEDIASERLVLNVKARGSNADLGDDGKTPSTEAMHSGYWLPKKYAPGWGTMEGLADYVREMNQKRLRGELDNEEEEEALRDILELPSMEKFISEERRTRTALVTRED